MQYKIVLENAKGIYVFKVKNYDTRSKFLGNLWWRQ